MLKWIVVISLHALLAFAAMSQCETGKWIRLSGPGPGNKYAHAMAYDGARDEVVLFGGSESVDVLGSISSETWTWSIATRQWALRNLVVRPTGVIDASMAFDPTHGRVVLFGGMRSDGSVLNQTWEWDGTSWTNWPTTIPPRFAHELFFDPVLGAVVLAFGSDAAGNREASTYRYSCESHSWTAMNPLPSTMTSVRPAIAYFPKFNSAFTFGGPALCCPQDPEFRGTGVFFSPNQAWGPYQSLGEPSGRYSCRFVHVNDLDRLLLFGGERIAAGLTNSLADTSLFNPDGAAWTSLSLDTNPTSLGHAGRGLYGMVAHPGLHGALLFGGRSLTDSTVTKFYGDTWVFTTRPWIDSGPSNGNVCGSSPVALSVSATGQGPLAYQWQILDTPGQWVDLDTSPTRLACGGRVSASAPHSPTTSIAIQACTGLLQYEVRCVVSNDCGGVVSGAAIVKVCVADFNCDGFVNGDDYDLFAELFEAGDAGADVNGDTFVNADDYDAFAEPFEAGC